MPRLPDETDQKVGQCPEAVGIRTHLLERKVVQLLKGS